MAQKSFVGVDQIHYALVTQDDSDAYAAGSVVAVPGAMNIAQAPKSNSKTQYADNQPFDVMSAEGETELDAEVTGIPLSVLAAWLGRVYDSANGRMYDNGGTPPYIAFGFRAEISGGNHRYYWFLKGQFQSPSEEQATKTDTPDPKSTKLKFTAVRTLYQFDLDGGDTIDSVKRVMGETVDSNFSATTWFDNVQVPAPGTPSALSATPNPADAATGVAAGVSPTVTFNNALAGGAEHGISLVLVSTGAAVALVRSIDAARKVVTLNPNADLTTSEQYLIVISGVTDVYGQTLADVAYDFTIA